MKTVIFDTALFFPKAFTHSTVTSPSNKFDIIILCVMIASVENSKTLSHLSVRVLNCLLRGSRRFMPKILMVRYFLEI